MGIRITCGLDSRSWAGFWKNDRAAVHAVRTIQYNNLLFIILYNYCIIFIIYYSSDLPSSLISESFSVSQSLSSLSLPSSSHRISSSDLSKALIMQHFLKDLTIWFLGWLSMQPTPTMRLLKELHFWFFQFLLTHEEDPKSKSDIVASTCP